MEQDIGPGRVRAELLLSAHKETITDSGVLEVESMDNSGASSSSVSSSSTFSKQKTHSAHPGYLDDFACDTVQCRNGLRGVFCIHLESE